jgi:FlaA1/EpsC-like NDP-sugar epimerase
VRSRKAGGRDRGVRPRRVIVVGAREAGVLVARESQKNPQLGIDIVGFVDDDKAKLGKSIAGIRVLGALRALSDVVQSYRIEEVVIAMPAAPGGVIRVMAETCRQLGVASKTVPGVYELLGDR